MLQIITNCYKVLHLEEGCSDLELRQRYRKVALELHPDRNNFKKLVNEEEDSTSDEENDFVKVNEAYRQIVSFRKGKKGKLSYNSK